MDKVQQIKSSEVKRFLKVTSDLIAHTKQLKKLRGENFNIFSILRLESAENRTHSNFLAELLNPIGSHGLKHFPLKQFLLAMGIEEKFPVEKAKIRTEYPIGKVDLEKGTGGRIDILIQFPDGSTVCIENKIGALDQIQQIRRYCNFNQPKNTVFYLTLDGKEPHNKSKLDKISGEHFHNISYSKNILAWLQVCTKEAAEIPILRESLRQYSILIKKLTNTLDAKEQTKLKSLIFEYLEEAEFVSANYSRAVYETKEDFRQELYKMLQSKLEKENWEVVINSDVEKNYSAIWINLKGIKQPQLQFGIEPFSGVGNFDGQLFVGIIDRKGDESDFNIVDLKEKFTTWWIIAEYLEDLQGERINLKQNYFLKKIHNPHSEERRLLMEHILKQILSFISKYKDDVTQFLQLKYAEELPLPSKLSS